MAEVPGAEQELRALGRTLLAQVRAVAARVTPDAPIPDSALPDAPEVAEWTDPPRYRFRLRAQTALASGAAPEDAVRRGAEALSAAGFEIAEEHRAGTVAARIVVTGTGDGFRIEVRVWPATGDVVYAGLTPTLALGPPRAAELPEPVRTVAEPGHVLCYECDGLGWCPACGGNGWVLDERGHRRLCPECHQQRVCPICRGAGQLQIARLRDTERAFYPELADGPVGQDEA
ncbi:hypothetical protein [Nocardia sp. AG03]|uniref:hypothetical protein n=1 Tax=Nocardia sp. AG03 TaxID=3025312 RepID=UPI0024185962|nr:hypothetical protein [Nocardia sp. AG03]